MATIKADIIRTLSNLRRGAFIQLVNEELSKLNRAMFETDGNGELQITLKFVCNGEGQVTCKPRVKAKLPIRDTGDGIFYLTVDGDLEREDPRQGALDLKVHTFDRSGGDEGEVN